MLNIHCNVAAKNPIDQLNAYGFSPSVFHAIKKVAEIIALVNISATRM